jgi:hypothetical protein
MGPLPGMQQPRMANLEGAGGYLPNPNTCVVVVTVIVVLVVSVPPVFVVVVSPE